MCIITQTVIKCLLRSYLVDILCQQVTSSYAPYDGVAIAHIKNGTIVDYNKCISASHKAWHVWADLPMPVRGDVIRQIGEALR